MILPTKFVFNSKQALCKIFRLFVLFLFSNSDSNNLYFFISSESSIKSFVVESYAYGSEFNYDKESYECGLAIL